MNMMEQFFAGMSEEDRKRMMAAMMMNMSGGGEGKEGGKTMDMTAMPQMMMEMMPRCLTMVLPNMPKEERMNFVAKMVSILVERGSAGLSEEEKKNFVEKVLETVKA